MGKMRPFSCGRLSDELLVDAANSTFYSLSVNPIMNGWLVNPWIMKTQIEGYLESYTQTISFDSKTDIHRNFEATFKRMIEVPMNKYCRST